MRFLHTADLHIGKTVHDFSMLKDQEYVLEQILELAVKRRVQAILIAGDVYDRSIPPAEAVEALDAFLTRCAGEHIVVLCIAGNHDSPERISFAERILEKQGIYLAGSYVNPPRRIRLPDEYGEVEFVLMPFVKPAMADAADSMEAVAAMLKKDGGSESDRRVLLTHFFVTDAGRMPELSDSETTVNVGGLDQVEASLLKGFDYVALGHIHKPQKVGSREIYYAGSPLAYSFSEAGRDKSVNLVELGEKGQVLVERVALKPRHGMRIIRGRLSELIRQEVAEAADREDYIQARLTDEEELIDPIGTLRSVYPNVMQLVLLRKEKTEDTPCRTSLTGKRRSTPELFEDFYRVVQDEELDEERRQIVQQAWKEVRE